MNTVRGFPPCVPVAVLSLLSASGIAGDTNFPQDTGLADVKRLYGAKGDAAIVNRKGGFLFARGVQTSGYANAIQDDAGTGKVVPGGKVEEFVSHPILSVFASPQRSLNLEIKETPEVEWGDPATWISVTKFGARPGGGVVGRPGGDDATDAVQKAIDSGATTVYFPKGQYLVDGTVHIRGKAERIIGLGQEATIRGAGHFQLEDGEPNVVVIENIQGLAKGFIQSSKRTVVLRDMAVQALGGLNTTDGFVSQSSGEVFLEDVVSSVLRFSGGGRIWARQLNTERQGTHILNDGCTLWILGLKTERGGTLVHTRGGRTELCGGFSYTTTDPEGAPMFLVENGSMSATMSEACFRRPPTPFDPLVREIRGGQTRELRKDQAPRRTGGGAISLFVGCAK